MPATGSGTFKKAQREDIARRRAADPEARDIMPAAIGDRNLNTAERRNVEVVVYEALRKLAKRGVLMQSESGAKAARFWTPDQI